MGKKKREEASSAVSEDISHPEAQPALSSQAKLQKKAGKSNNPKNKVLKAVEKQKKVNDSNVKSKSEVGKVNEIGKSSKSKDVASVYTTSSSDSESEKNSNKNDKKSVSDSNSESDSDSSDSDSSPSVKNIKCKPEGTQPVTQTKNSIVNLSPIKSYKSPPKSSSSDSYHSDTEEEDKKRRKKQKKLFKLQLNKKARRGNTPKKEIKMELHEELDIKEEFIYDDGMDNIASNNDDVPDWPEADYSELLRRMETQISPKDNLKFDSRAAKLDWNKVAFGDYTAEDCFDMWTRISKRIRRFRILSEMIVDAKDWITKPWTNFYRGSKKNRHPDMPSRPLSTYMIYYLEHKDKVAKDNPGLEMTQVSKIISEMYKTLSSKERDKYTEMAAKERQNFDEKLSEFYREHPDMIPQIQNKSSTREVVTKGPRKPSAPFKLFFQEQLKMYGDDVYDRKAAEEAAKEKWKNLNDKKKLVWINWALQDAKRYEDELKVYLLEHPDYVAPVSAKSVLNKDERTIKERLSGKPVKPPNSAYSLFSRVMLQSDVDIKSVAPKLRMAEISKKWREISDTQRHKYEEKVRQLQDAYKLEFASYLEGLSKEEREVELQKNQPKRKIKTEEKPVKKKAVKAPSNVVIKTETRSRDNLNLYKGEPEPPPVRVFDLFLQTFLAERPLGTSEATRLKEAPRYWEILPESKKEVYGKKLLDLKQKYIHDYEVFLKGLSPEELKEFSVLKAKAKKMEEAQEQMERINGTLSDSNEESEENKFDSSSDSDSEDSDSGKSSKSSSSSEDSE